jgi:hypothetical protein
LIDTTGASSSITQSQAFAALLFVLGAKDAGARLVLQTYEPPIAEVFRFDVGPGYDVGKWAEAQDKV